MNEVSIIGVDLAKQVFQLHGATAEGQVVFRKKLSRTQFVAFMRAQPGCCVAMEACARVHHWARTLMDLGDEVRLIAPKFVEPYVKNQKNDMADWPAAGFVDTRLSLHNAGLECHWAEIAQLRMASLRIVEALDVVEHVGPGGVTRAVDLAGSPFGFQRGEEALHCRVVPYVAGPAHRAGDAVVV